MMSPHTHRSLYRLTCLAGLGLFAGSVLMADVEPIVPPAKRTELLERARLLLATQEVSAKRANPFFSETFNEVRFGTSGQTQTDTAVAAPVGPKSNRDLLESIATSLKPSGFFVFGGEPTLVFGQKRVKAGGMLTINFEGKEYALEVTNVDRTHFTLRLNREEFTRPIK